MKEILKKIAIVGGGPSALFMYKTLLDAYDSTISIDIFERSKTLGAGMPYSDAGAGDEHITNVSDNEIPALVTSVGDWAKEAPEEWLNHFDISSKEFNEYKVFPRLFFGKYLSAQFSLLLGKAKKNNIKTQVYLNSNVTDIADKPGEQKVSVITENGCSYFFDHVVICTGHNWPKIYEGSIPGYFDSPYPPSKLALQVNYPVAIRGSSLTAIDAVRTIARYNGNFIKKENGMPAYELSEESRNFKMVMYSRHGMLPAIRFHLQDSHLAKDSGLSAEAIVQNRKANDGFLSLDHVFEKNFKEPIRDSDPEMYDRIKDMDIETFVDEMMKLREALDAFTLFKAEYTEAEKSIKRKKSVYWKEMLGVLSFAMNYPAKYFSAEDMIRLQKVLMPLISIVIAYAPQSSCEELIALYNAGLLEIVAVGEDSSVTPAESGGAIVHYLDKSNIKQSVTYKLFVDSIGQPHLHYDQFPFKSLLDEKVISRALLKFRSPQQGEVAYKNDTVKIEKSVAGDYYLKVPGITINDYFQVVDTYGAANSRIYIMAVPYIAGYNPDYSGLDFCEAASAKIVQQLLNKTDQPT